MRRTTTLRMTLALAVVATGAVVVSPPASADFSPDIYNPATAGTTGLFSATFNTGTTVGQIPTGWTGSGWLVRDTALTSPMPDPDGAGSLTAPAAGVIPVLDGRYIALDNDVVASGTITSPIIDLTTATNPYLDFDVHSFFLTGAEGNQGFDTDKSYVQINVLDSAGTLLDQVFELGDTDINNTAGWLPQTVRLADFAGQQIRLQIVYVDEGAASNNDQHDIALDNIRVVNVAQPDGSDFIAEVAGATYFLPISDADVTVAQTHIFSNEVCNNTNDVGPQDTVTMLTSITIGDTPLDANGQDTSALVIYDHVEDGFGPTNRRTQSTTELWGDGDPSNGYPPGHPEDLLYPGEVVVMRTVSDPGVTSPLFPGAEVDSVDSTQGYTLGYDAGDRLTSPTGLVITRTGWNDGSSTLLADAVEVSDVSSWGTVYEMPIGQNLSTSGAVPGSFEYVSAAIMARNNGTVVTLPNGSTVTLDAGESYLINGGLNVGDTISSSGGPIGVNILAGNVCSTFEMRWFRLDPVRLFDDLYYTPVSGEGTQGGTSVMLYNPGTSSITVVVYDDDSATVPQATVNVPAGTTVRYDIIDTTTGTSFQSTGGEPFYAVQVYDTSSTERDWGYALLGLDQLSPVLQAGLAIGVDPTSGNATSINSPLWIAGIWIGAGTPTGGVTICVDWNGNGGALSTNGTAYDTTKFIDAHLDNEILDEADTPPSNDLTGTKVFVCNPSNPTDPNLANWVLAGAWGQDTTGPGGSPSLDVGTGVFNLPTFSMDKALVLIDDDNNNGIVDVGDTVRYSLTVTNTSGVIIQTNRLKVWDNLPAELDYLEGTTTIDPELAPLSGTSSGTPARMTANHSNLCIEVTGSSTASGAVVQQNTCTGGANQQIAIRDVGGAVELSFAHSGLCVGVQGASLTDNAPIVQLPCGSTGTRFAMTGTSTSYAFQAVHSGKCLDVMGVNTAPGTDLIQWSCVSSSANQHFTWSGTVGAPTGTTGPETVPDDVGGVTAFPLDDADSSNVSFEDPNNEFSDTVDDGVWWNRQLYGGQSFTITFDAEILEVPANNLVINTALVTDGRYVRTDQVAFQIPEYITIGDRVWLDEDGDGVQDAGEDGIAGVPVQLKYTLSDGTVVTVSTITDADGGYVFTNVPVLPEDGTYTVTITAPTGMNQTYDEQGPLDLTITLVSDPLSLDPNNPLALQPGDQHMTADFGLNWVPPVNTDTGTGVGAIGDRIWSDADGDGIQDPGEAGIAGVTVQLYADPDGNGVYDTLVRSTTTNANGNYIFDDLAAGAYVVRVVTSTLPAGMTQTGDPDATLDNASQPIPLAPGDVYVNADFGYRPAAGSVADNTIGDTIWLDGDGDGVIDAGEPRFAGVSVVLLDATGRVVATDVTDANGTYLFTGVPAGTYTVWVNDAANVLGEYAQVSDPDATLDERTTVTVDGNDDILTADFGYAPPDSDPDEGLIGDTIFLDRDNDGIADAGEGIEGVRVELYDEFDRLVGVTYTNENGQYAFGDLAPTVDGEYRVVVDTSTLPAGLTSTVDPDGGADSSATTSLGDGQQIYTMDFGYRPTQPATLSGTIWEDTDADGVLEATEAARFAGVTVVLTQLVDETVVVTDPDTQQQITLTTTVERVVATTTTDANGNYSFVGLSGGQYIVRVTDDANVLGGYWHSDAPVPGTNNQSQDDEGYLVTLPAGGTNSTADFGYYIDPGAVGNTVFNDLDGDGRQDAGEVGIAGATVQLTITYPNGTVTTLVTTTDANGTYSFGNLLLDEDHNGDTTTAGTAEPTFVVSVTDLPPAFDNAVSTHTQSSRPLDSTTIGGTAADDLDADNPAGEPAYPGQGITDNTNDFGFVLEAVLGNFVWEDRDGDGIQDLGEPGIGGVTVRLFADRDGNGVYTDLVATVTTAADGSYLFTDLLPGNYQIQFVAPSGMVFSPANQGTNDLVDTDANAGGVTPVINMSPGETDLSVDAGLYRPVSIGDLVYNDITGNGQYDATDPGLAGVTVQLWRDTNGDGTLDTLVTSTTTAPGGTDVTGDGIADPAGTYLFRNLPPGSYGVVVTATGPLALSGWEQTVDPDATVDGRTTTAIVLLSGTTNTAQDFGYFRPAVIGDTVWYDADNDGVQDAGEPGISGVTVQLLDASGAVIKTDVTDATGQYLFEDLPAGSYTVRVVTSTLPTGFADAINTFDLDGNRNSQTPVTVVAGQSQLTVDFGYFDPGTIGDTVYHDVNGNGIQDAGEPGLAGVTVQLWADTNGDGIADGTSPIRTTETLVNGTYLFTNLPADDYVVKVVTSTLPTNFLPAINSDDPDQTSNKDLPGDSTSAVDLDAGGSVPAGITNLNQDFGYFIGGSIGDRVFEDVDNDGVQDAGEPGFAGVTVELRNSAGTLIGTDVTDSNGIYTFDNLPPGTYTVTVVTSTLPAGAVQTYEKAPADFNSSTTQTLTVGQDVTDVDFGYFRPATIGDFVWDDLDGDGVQDAGEPGVAGVTVQLVNSSGATVATTTTDGSGLYEFTDVVPGTYTVRFILPNEDYIYTDPNVGNDALDSDALVTANPLVAVTAPFVVTSGATITTIDAGLVQTGALGDRVWSDTDGDGVQDAGEPGIAGATVQLFAVGNPTPLASQLTDASGLYLFDDLAPGDYYVVVTPPTTDTYLVSPQNASGNDATDSDINASRVSDVATVGIGQVVDTVDAGFVPASSIGDRVWRDTDGDGIQDVGEPGVAGITVKLLDATGAVIATTTTNSSGLYSFTNLYPGTYSVQFVAPAGTVFSPQDVGALDSADSDANATGLTAPIVLASNQDIATVDAGLIQTGSIGDRVWYDTDGDGIQDAGEAGLAGVTVQLLNSSGTVIATTTTNATGIYTFSGLVPGQYTVVFGNTVGTSTYLFSPRDATNDDVDSDADRTNGATAPITLGYGQNITTVDAGLVLPASISGTVTEDITNDTTGDLPLGGVTVNLYRDTDGDGDADGAPIATTTTNPDGTYTFTNLLPGNYVVVEVNRAGYVDISDRDTITDGDLFDTDTNVDGTVPVRLTAGEADLGNDFVDRLPASIQVVKTAGNAADGVPYVANGIVGETVTYTFVITNTGVATLSNVTLTDPLPNLQNLTCGSPNVNGTAVLVSGATLTCTAQYQLTQADIDAGSVLNVATVRAERPGGSTTNPADDVVDTDPAAVTIPQEPAIDIVKSTNGVDSSSAPGVIVEVGDAITWTYVVTNTGNTVLADVTVDDDRVDNVEYLSGDGNDNGLLDVGESWTFQATGVATAGQYVNVATATGNPVDADGDDLPGLTNPTATDDDYYFAADASIDIQKTVVAGAGAACPGTELVTGESGDAVTYCFVVKNTGNVRLDGVVVTDPDILGATVLPVAATLLPGQSATVSVDSVIAGDLTNTATATGTPIDTVTDPANPAPFDPTVVPKPTDTDTARVDETPTFDVVKTNDANGDGTFTDTEEQTVTPDTEPFRVEFTNEGVDPIVFKGLTDSVGGVKRTLTDLVCTVDGAPLVAGGQIPGGSTVVCTFTALVDLTVAVDEVDTVTVTVADIDNGEEFTDSDTSTVLQPNRGLISGVVYEDLGGVIGDQDAGDPGIPDAVVTITPPAGIDLGAGAGVAVTVPVADGVTDDLDGDGTIDPAGFYYVDNLLPGSYTITIDTLPDPYQQFEDPDGTPDNTTIVVLPAGGEDTGNDFGYAQPSVDIEKSTNGQDADTPTGPFIPTGGQVTWTYVVTNTGIVAISDVTVNDDREGEIVSFTGDDGDGVLEPGEIWIYTAVGVATDGQYANVATVSGTWTDSTGTPQTDTFDDDPSHYVGVRPAIDVQKTVTLGTNCPGGELVSGANGTAVTYCFTITNTGNIRLDDVQLDDADLGVSLADLTHVGGVAPVNGVLDLAPSQTSTFSYAATIEGDLVNTAEVTGTPIDTFTDPANPAPFDPAVVPAPTDSDTAEVDETPTFTVVKTNNADGALPYSDTESAQSAISTVPFRVVITNTGDDAAVFTSITDTVGGAPRTMTGLTCVLASTGASISVGGTIPAGGTVTCNFTAQVDLTLQASETDVITVVLSDDDGNDVRGQDDSTVEGAAAIAHTKNFVSATDPNADGVYTVVYTVVVRNTGTTTDTYDLADTPQFDTDLTVTGGTATVATTGANAPATPAAFAGPSWPLAADQPLAPGETHTYTLTFTVDATDVVADPTVLDPCVPTQGEPGAGLFNVATLTVDGTDVPAEACGNLPLLQIDKTFVSAVDPDGDATFTVTYTVEVANVGTAATSYGLTDSPQPDTDIVIESGSATVVSDGVNVPSTPAVWGSNPWTLATAQAIAVGETHTYTLVFQADAGALFVDPTQLDECDPTDPVPGDGLFNAATVTSAAGTLTDDACGDPLIPRIDVDKTFVSATDADADGIYDVVYTVVVDNTGDGAGVYTLADTPSFDADLVITGGSATVTGNGANTPATPAAFASAPWPLATAQTIAGGETHTFTLTFTVDAAAVATNPAALSPCATVTPVAGEGLFNAATLTYDGVTVDDDDCGDLPLLTLDKTFVSAVDPDGDGTFTVTYTIAVANAGTAATSYDLADSPQPDTDIVVASGSATVVSDGVNVPSTPAAWSSNPWTLATAQAIAAGETHTYTLVFQADAGALLVDPSSYDPCDPTAPVAGEGLFNEATLTSVAGTLTDDACGDPGIPAITTDKTFVSASDVDDDGVYTVVYTVTATNTGTGSGVYDLTDAPAFDAQLSILSGVAAPTSSDAGNVPPAPAAYSSSPWTLASDQTIVAGATHTFTLTFEVDATAVVADPALFGPCGDPTPVAGEGLFNAATLTYGDVTETDDDCGDLPLLTIDKQGPTITTDVDADGEIDLGDTLGYTIVVTNAGGVPLTGVTVVDSIIEPQNIVCVRADGSSFEHLAGDDLAVGETVTCSGTYVVVETDVVAGKVVNVATADSNETPPVDDTVTGPIPPAVTITKNVAAPVSLGNGQYRITYTIVVGNTGSAGTYWLDDELQYGDGITINAAKVVNSVPGTVTTNSAWNGVDNVIVVSSASPVALGYGQTHVYTVTVDATVDPYVAYPDGVLCPPPGSGENGGFANTATVSMDDDVVSDDACVPPPAPNLTISKAVTSGPTLEADGTYTVQYLVTVRNTSNGIGLYDLTDDLEFGAGIDVLGATMVNVAPGTIPVLASWNGVSSLLAVDDARIAAFGVHTFRVTVRADALGLDSPAAGECSTGEPPTAGGFLNVATVTANGVAKSADDCVPVPPPGLSITKLVSPDSPVSNGDGTYDVTYTVSVVNSEAGPGLYTLTDDIAFGAGVTVESVSVSSTDVPNDLSAWTGSGVIAADVPITGITTHEYTIVATVSLEPTMTATARDCTLDEGEEGTGLLNNADLLVGGQVIDHDDACVQTPAPAIVVTKNVATDGFTINPDGSYSITYDVIVSNAGAAPGQYELDDELTFGDGITIDSAVVSSTVPAGLTTNTSWNGVDVVDLTVAPVALDGTDDATGTTQHVYTITVTGDASGLSSATAGDCTLDEGETGTGYLNTATLTFEGQETSDDACDPNPDPAVTVAKSLTAGPTLQADGTFAIEYRVVVTNTGGFGTYDLSDAVAFGGGITVVLDSAEVTVAAPLDGSIEAGTGWLGDVWNGTDNTTITTGQAIAAGGSHTYVIRLVAAVDPLEFEAVVDGVCPPPNTDGTGGFLNVATVTSAGVEQSDDACAPVPDPDLVVTKNIVSGPTDLGAGSYEIVYDIVVRNEGAGPDAYLLDDELRFGDGITVLSADVENVAPGDIVVSGTWNGIADRRVVTAQPIAGMASHTYRVTVTVDALTVLTTDEAACSTAGSLERGGFLNVATISSSSTDMSADDCGEVPLPDISVAKGVVAGPTERTTEPGVYDITYQIVVSNAGAGSGRYDLADDLRFGDGITVRSATISSGDVTTDLSAWAGNGPVTLDEPIDADESHVYTVVVVAEMAAATLGTARDCQLVVGEDGTGLLNTATLSGPLVETQRADACGELPDPDISIVKSVVSGPTRVSGTRYDVTYSIVVTNAGLGLGQYDLADSLRYGAGVTVVSSSITSTDVDLSASTWNGLDVTDVVAGAAIEGTSAHAYTVKVRVDVAPGTTPAARDCVVGLGETGTGLLNDVAMTVPGTEVPATDSACVPLPAPAFAVTKSVVSGPTLGANGQYTMVYRIVARNTGAGPGVYDLRDQPQFGPAITITSASITSTTAPMPSPAIWNPLGGKYLAATGLALAAGESDTFIVTLTASIDAVELDETLATCVGGHGSTESEFYNRTDVLVGGVPVATDDACEPPPVPKLEITKSVTPGSLTYRRDNTYEVVYSITVSNTGNGPTVYTVTDTFAFADGVEVLDVEVVSKPTTATLLPGFDGASRNRVATAPLGAKSSHTYQIKVVVRTTAVQSENAFDCILQPGETGTGLLNRAQVNPTAEACVPLPKYTDLELSKVVSKDSVFVGDQVTFTLFVANTGPIDATNVSVKDVLPSGLTYVSSSGDGSYNPSTGMWTIGALKVGQLVEMDIVVKVTREARIVNSAQVWTSSLPDPDSTPANNVPTEDDQDTATVTARPLVVVEPPAPPPATLPPTGGSTHGPITMATWLLVAGAGMLAVATRRRSRSAAR